MESIAIVTGAASGIGRGIALELGRRGGYVCAADIDGEGIRRTADEIVAAGGRADATRLDVADNAAVRAIVEDVAARTGGWTRCSTSRAKAHGIRVNVL